MDAPLYHSKHGFARTSTAVFCFEIGRGPLEGTRAARLSNERTRNFQSPGGKGRPPSCARGSVLTYTLVMWGQSTPSPEAVDSYMGAKSRAPLCVYCAREDGVTVDHIPPKLFLSRPYPENLLTVPACRRCNASFQADDEYTRFVASVDLRSAEQKVVRSKMSAIARSLQRPDAKSFAQYLGSQMKSTTVLGPDGRPLAQVEVDRKRINATGERIVRGSFFIETGKPLPPSTKVRVGSKAGIAASDPAILEFARLYRSCQDRRSKGIGDAFGYVAAFGSGFSIWFLLLYDHFSWLATIGGSGDATE